MAIRTIPSLPAAISLNGTEEIPAVQAGTDVRITTAQIVSLVAMATTAFTAEELTVTALNTVSNLSLSPKNGLLMLFVNGQAFFNVGAGAAFTLAGQVVNWSSTTYSIQTVDIVYAVYGV